MKGDLTYLLDFPGFSQGRGQLYDFLFSFLYTTPFSKWVNYKRQAFSPSGSKFFPFRIDPFSKGRRTILTELPVLKVYRLPFKRS